MTVKYSWTMLVFGFHHTKMKQYWNMKEYFLLLCSILIKPFLLSELVFTAPDNNTACLHQFTVSTSLTWTETLFKMSPSASCVCVIVYWRAIAWDKGELSSSAWRGAHTSAHLHLHALTYTQRVEILIKVHCFSN